MVLKRKAHLSVLVALLMIFSLFPVSALAAETVTVPNLTFTKDTTDADIAAAWGEGAATIAQTGDGAFLVTLHKNIILKDGATMPITFGSFSQGAGQPMMILDLNGCTVSGKTIVISNMGNLTIKDSVGTGKVVYDGGAYLTAVNNTGYSLTINGGTFVCNGANSASYNAAISSAATTTTVINGGTFEGNGAGALITYGETTINGGNFNGAYGVVAKKNSSGSAGVVVFPEGSKAQVTADKMTFVVEGDGTLDGSVVVKGGNFDAPAIAGKLGQAVPTEKISITGGNFAADPSGYVPADTAVAGFSDGDTPAETSYVVGAGKIAEKAANAASGDTINILSGDVALDIASDDVTVVNNGSGNVSVNDEPLEKDGSTTTCIHVWGAPVWNWAADNASASATFTCEKDPQHVQSVTAQVTEQITPATCTSAGEAIYTASVTFGGQVMTDEKTVSIPAASHGETVLQNAKLPTCTAEGYTGDLVCKACGQVVTPGQAIAVIAHSYQDGKCTICGQAEPQTAPSGTTSSTDNGAGSPQTGENNLTVMWLALALVSLCGVAGCVLYRHKQAHYNK